MPHRCYKAFRNHREGEGLLHPGDFGMPYNSGEALHGGESLSEAADIFMAVLENRSAEAQKNTVLANSALAIYCYKKNESLADCVEYARESIDSKTALKSFKKLIEMQ
ncbi:MAG: hypothetical protein R6U58_10820 [Bacteroidales bacterium]